MTYPHGGASEIWRDGTGTTHNPAKGQIRDWGSRVESDLTSLDGRLGTLEATGTVGYTFVFGGPVAAATTAAVTLSGEQTIDGVVTSASRILVKDQADAAENGIYVTAAGAWTRAADMDAAAEIQAKAVTVAEGTSHGGKVFITYSAVTILGTDDIDWVDGPDSSGAQGQINALQDVVDKVVVAAAGDRIPKSKSYTGKLDATWLPRTMIGTQFALADQPLLAGFDRLIDFRRGAYVSLAGGVPNPETYLDAMDCSLQEPIGAITVNPAASVNVCANGLNFGRVDGFTSSPAGVTVDVVDVADLPDDIRDAFAALTLDGLPVARVLHITSSGSANLTDWGAIGTAASATASAYVWAVSGNVQVSRQNLTPFSSVATQGQLERVSTSLTGSATDKMKLRMSAGSDFYVTGMMFNEGALTDCVRSEKSKWSLFVNEDSLGEGMLRITVRFPTEGAEEFDYLFYADNKGEASPPSLAIWMDWTTGNIRFEASQPGSGSNMVSVPAAWSPDQPITIAASWEDGGRIGLSVNGATPAYLDTNSPDLSAMTRVLVGGDLDSTTAAPQADTITDGVEIWDFAYKEGFA